MSEAQVHYTPQPVLLTPTGKPRKIHECLLCGYKTPYACNMKTHLKRIMPCRNVTFDDPAYTTMMTNYASQSTKTKTSQNAQECASKHACKTCGKEFKNRSSIYRHKCKSVDLVSSKLVELEEKLKSLQAIPQAVPKAPDIRPFGDEDTTILTPAFLDQCLRRTDKGHVELVNFMYFFCKHNQCVKASRQLRSLLAYDGEVWVRQHENDIIDGMIRKSYDVLRDHIDANVTRLRQEFSESLFDAVWEYLDKIDNKDLNIYMKLRPKILRVINNFYKVRSMTLDV